MYTMTPIMSLIQAYKLNFISTVYYRCTRGILDLTLVPVSLKVKKEFVELAEEMVKLGIARSRNHAFNIILEKGMREARRLVEEEKKVEKIVEIIKEKGGLKIEVTDASKELTRMRDRFWST